MCIRITIYVTEGFDLVEDFLNSIRLLLIFPLYLWKKTKFAFSLVGGDLILKIEKIKDILSFNLKEQLSLLLQNVYEVKQSTPALRSVFTMCDSTRQNGLVTYCLPCCKMAVLNCWWKD